MSELRWLDARSRTARAQQHPIRTFEQCYCSYMVDNAQVTVTLVAIFNPKGANYALFLRRCLLIVVFWVTRTYGELLK